jgi:uncharacterized membrane protein YeaQ/YmgE (transglycosylase-associated protein family)
MGNFTIVGIISWIVFGLIVGAVARAIMPGRQSMSIPMTVLLGIGGSFAGGTLSTLLFRGSENYVQAGGWIMSILGALLVLFIYSRAAARPK